jgi:hypothetical protein
VAALARQKYPCRLPDEILAAQQSTAVPVGTYPVNTAGAGLIDANATLGALQTCTQPATLFHPIAPLRVLDSRPGPGNVGGYTTPWTSGTTRPVTVGGLGTIPIDAVSVVLNVTVTGTTGSSFLTLWPNWQAKPNASSLNWTPGVTIPNAVTVKLGSGGLNAGKVSVFNLSGNADVIIDVAGYYTAATGDGFTSQAPARILDSRPGPGNIGGFATPWAGGTTRDITMVGGVSGVPSDADAVVLNVTVTGTTGSSFLTLWPTGQAKPTASSLNWTPGRTIPNAVTVKLGSGGLNAGKVSVFNLSGNADVIIDVAGYYKAGVGKAFHAIAPVRVLDSRPGITNAGLYQTPWTTGTSRLVPIGGLGVLLGADSVVVNTTVTGTTGSSFLTVWPAGVSQPTASNLNWTPGLTIPNAVTVKLGIGGSNAAKVSMFNLSGNVDVITDVAGWFS